MKNIMVRFTDGFVKLFKVAKDLSNAEIVKDLREQGWGNVQTIEEIG